MAHPVSGLPTQRMQDAACECEHVTFDVDTCHCETHAAQASIGRMHSCGSCTEEQPDEERDPGAPQITIPSHPHSRSVGCWPKQYCGIDQDRIGEEELYRCLAENPLAMVPHGTTLEHHLADLILRCACTGSPLTARVFKQCRCK